MRCCCNPIIPVFEYEIGNNILSPPKENLQLPITPEFDVDLLKDKVICDYLSIISKLERGQKPELESLLQDLSQIYIKEIENNTAQVSSADYIPPATYIGFGVENINELKLNSLTAKHLENIKMTETINNRVRGNHLWIISPYTLHKVATDENFTFEVKMNLVAYKSGLRYYRSNSKVDICNLTYYIK